MKFVAFERAKQGTGASRRLRISGKTPGIVYGGEAAPQLIEIDHNARPRIAGRGSAVFLHLARPGYGPTAGCVSMKQPAMLRLLERIGPQTKIVIG